MATAPFQIFRIVPFGDADVRLFEREVSRETPAKVGDAIRQLGAEFPASEFAVHTDGAEVLTVDALDTVEVSS